MLGSGGVCQGKSLALPLQGQHVKFAERGGGGSVVKRQPTCFQRGAPEADEDDEEEEKDASSHGQV